MHYGRGSGYRRNYNFVRSNIPIPIVTIHGAGRVGTSFLRTPDGRGWAEFFLWKGYAVYVVDQPGRGKSGYQEINTDLPHE